MKYGLPTDDGETVGAVFGRAKSFAIYDETTSRFSIIHNEGANSEHGAGIGAAAFLADEGVGVVIAPEVGPKATAALSAAKIRIVAAEPGASLGSVVTAVISKEG